jgi:hypothetical protein
MLHLLLRYGVEHSRRSGLFRHQSDIEYQVSYQLCEDFRSDIAFSSCLYAVHISNSPCVKFSASSAYLLFYKACRSDDWHSACRPGIFGGVKSRVRILYCLSVASEKRPQRRELVRPSGVLTVVQLPYRAVRLLAM